MNKFWKKQLPAFLLAMILMVGMMPAAMAAETHNWSDWAKQDDATHIRFCQDDGCDQKEEAQHQFTVETTPATCTTEGKRVSTCSVCKFIKEETLKKTEHNWSLTGSIPATCTQKGSATYKCLDCGETKTEEIATIAHSWDSGTVTKAATCTATGIKTYTCSECGATKTETIPAAGHRWSGGVCTVCGAKNTSSQTGKNFSIDMETSDSGTIGGTVRSKINSYFSGNFSTVTFGSPSGTSYGTLYANSGRKSLSTREYTYSSSGSYPVSSLYFVSSSREGTYSIPYTAKDTSGNTVSGKLYIYVEGSASSGTTIEYTVKAGGEVSFKKSDFQEAFEEEYSTGTIKWVTFETDDTLSTSKGTVYYDYDGSDEKAFTASSIEDYDFYYSSSSYGDYALTDLSYVAPKGTSSRTVELYYTAWYSDSKYVEGTVEIKVTGGAGGSSGDTITYEVDPGDYVEFKTSHFKDVYENELDGTIRYVTFETDDTLSTSNGTIYYNYDESGEKSFTKSSIDDYDFYYSSKSYGDYALANLSFVAPDDADERTVELSFRVYDSDGDYVSGTVEIEIGSSSGKSGDTITYEVDPGDYVEFKTSHFKDVYEDELDGTIRYVTFETDDALSTANGTVYYNYDESGEKAFTKSSIDDYKFYYNSKSYGDYALANLSFVAPKSADERTVELDFRVYDSDGDYVSGTVEIEIGSGSSSKGDLAWEVAPGKELDFDRTDFNAYYQDEKNTSNTIKWVTFETDSTLNTTNGTVYADYDGSDEKAFTKSSIDDYKFYYSSKSYGDYALSDLSFVAGKSFTTPVELDFKAYYSSSSYAEGTLVISPSGTVISTGYRGDILYTSTYNATVQIKAGDIERFFHSKYPSSTFQSVVLGGVPAAGSLYYNYFGVSKYGASKLKLTASNCKQNTLYASPTSNSQYALTELLYVPSGSNYCVTIPFTAYGSGSKSASGTILISVNLSAVGEVYGVTPKNTAVGFPASAIFSAVAGASGTNLASIQLLKLPAASVGTVYVGSGTGTKADITTKYGYSSGTQKISQLRFVPASGYTGSVEIPYVAYNSSGTAVAAGRFSLGVVSAIKKFSDVTSSTWCYKYVVELADGKVIDGYANGTFKPDNTITYGAALKLIMLAAGYPEQKPTGSNVFSGYLTKARAEGIITRSNVDLTKPITRLQVAQLAAGALKLNKTNLSSVKPFTDTTDASVQALNAAGIVEGYFSGGTSTYKPNNTLTRGQVSAIVWRMRNYSK